jgi:hypothetical protein
MWGDWAYLRQWLSFCSLLAPLGVLLREQEREEGCAAQELAVETFLLSHVR